MEKYNACFKICEFPSYTDFIRNGKNSWEKQTGLKQQKALSARLTRNSWLKLQATGFFVFFWNFIFHYGIKFKRYKRRDIQWEESPLCSYHSATHFPSLQVNTIIRFLCSNHCKFHERADGTEAFLKTTGIISTELRKRLSNRLIIRMSRKTGETGALLTLCVLWRLIVLRKF